MIQIELTNPQFYQLFGQSEYVRNYTTDAIDQILSVHAMRQQDSKDTLDWTPIFMNSSEYTSREDFIKAYKHECHDSTLENLEMYKDDTEYYNEQLANHLKSMLYAYKLENGNYLNIE